jgi:hypothetical protein
MADELANDLFGKSGELHDRCVYPSCLTVVEQSQIRIPPEETKGSRASPAIGSLGNSLRSSSFIFFDSNLVFGEHCTEASRTYNRIQS